MQIFELNVEDDLWIWQDVSLRILPFNEYKGVVRESVRIGINAPQQIKIWRKEIYDKIAHLQKIGS